MMNLSEVVTLLGNLASGKGVYLAGATGPYFVRSDGSIIDKDGNMVAQASAVGKKYYDDYVGNFPLTGVVPAAQLPLATGSARGAIVAAAKGAGETVEVKIGTDGKLYVPAYPTDAQYDLTPFIVEFDSIVAAPPTVYADGGLWIDEGAAKIYVITNGAWVEITANKVVEATTAPPIYVTGDFWIKQNVGADELFVQTANAWVASAAPFSEAATAPATPTAGDYYYDTATNKLYYCAVSTWAEVTSHAYVRAASAPVIYVEGDYWYDTDEPLLYVNESGTWTEYNDAPYVYTATEPDLYAVGDKIYITALTAIVGFIDVEGVLTIDVAHAVFASSGKLYTDGTDLYEYNSTDGLYKLGEVPTRGGES